MRKREKASFYFVKVGKKYVRVTQGSRMKLVGKVNDCSYWTSKMTLKSWDFVLKMKFGEYKIVPAKLVEA